MTDRDPPYRRHRFPAEIIAHAVWLYFRFPLSLLTVEDLLAARGIIVSHQTIRLWAEKFGSAFANEIHRRSFFRLGDMWQLDEAVFDPGQEALAMARRGSQQFRPGRSGATPPRRQGGQTPDAQPSERPVTIAARDDQRQAQILRRSKTGNHARRRAPLS